MGKSVYLSDKEIEILLTFIRFIDPEDIDIEIINKLENKLKR